MIGVIFMEFQKNGNYKFQIFTENPSFNFIVINFNIDTNGEIFYNEPSFEY